MRTVTTRWAIPVALVGALLAGCGTNDKTGSPAPAATSAAPAGNGVADKAPDEILKDAKAALLAAKSFHVKGTVVDEGESITMDLSISGKDVKGMMSAAGQGQVELLSVGGQNYIRPDAKFWTQTAGEQGETLAKMMGDKWAKVSSTDKDLAELFSFADIDQMLEPEGTVTKGDTKQINGVDAIALLDGGSPDSKLWIATSGEPYPLLMEAGDAKDGKMEFVDYGKDMGIKAPADADVIDFDKLIGG